MNTNDNDVLEIRLTDKICLDKTVDKFYNFDPHKYVFVIYNFSLEKAKVKKISKIESMKFFGIFGF